MQNLEVMVMLFTMVILGYAACKLGYMGDKFDKKLSSIVVDITCPLLVLSSVMGDEMPDRSPTSFCWCLVSGFPDSYPRIMTTRA